MLSRPASRRILRAALVLCATLVPWTDTVAGDWPARTAVETKSAATHDVDKTLNHTHLAKLAVGANTRRRSAELEEIIFAVRKPGNDGHWYANFGYWNENPNHKLYNHGGKLCRLNVHSKALQVLLDDPQGTVRDPAVHYDGKKILFSYRKGGTETFHLYEINSDGTGLTQLTEGLYDDIEPTYLPDGGIMFCSARARRWVPCWHTQVATLHRCDGDGGNIRPLSSNIEHDNTPWMLPDGRVAYTRWEYVDRSQMTFHHLWTMNPDGTAQRTYYGNLHPNDLYIDAKPIPGLPDQIVMVNSPGHGQQEHYGRIAMVDMSRGPDDRQAQTIINGGSFIDPYPLSPDSILVAQDTRILLMNRSGATREIYTLPAEHAAGGLKIHEPRPLQPRLREPVIPDKTDLNQRTGQLIVMDTYIGRNMGGVERGVIKKLLILENLCRPTSYGGDSFEMEPLTYGGSWALTRVLGTVPVEPDGSANLEVPANRSLFFVALDANDLSVKRMLSFLTVMPGEVNACIGCHENRTMAGPAIPVSQAQALHRPPSRIEPVAGMPEIFDFPRDIQPLLDKYCIACHNAEKYEGRILLTGDQGPVYSHSYFTLASRLQMADGRNLSRGNYPPYTIGSAKSPLLNKVDGSHHDVRVTEFELRLLKLWIDASAAWAGTYGALESGMLVGTHDWQSVKDARGVLDRRCASCHRGDKSLPAHLSDRPEPGVTGCLPYGETRRHPWDPPWIKPYGDGSLKVGSREWMRRYADPRQIYSVHLVYNLSRPEKSLQLLAPLTKAAGGYEICGPVFADTSDPDYQTLLRAIQDGKRELDRIKRFNLPGFKPRREYTREMKRYGVLPSSYNEGDPINSYETDQKYWKSFWHEPVNSR